MSDSKILFTFKNEDGNFQVESVWATKQGKYYKIDNIPFLVSNIALGDLVSVEEDENVLHFDELIEPSGHSTIQTIIFDVNELPKFCKNIENFGCTWEGGHIKSLIAIDVPKNVDYALLKSYLDKGEEQNLWSYREACLAH